MHWLILVACRSGGLIGLFKCFVVSITGSITTSYTAYVAAWLETVEPTYIYNKMLIAHSFVEYQIYYYPRLGIFHSGLRPREIFPPRVVINYDIQRRSVQ